MDKEVEKLLLSAKETAKVLNFSLSFFYLLHSQGKVPLPRKFGRLTLWSIQEIKDWIASGCPARAEWQVQQKRKNEND